MITSTLIDTLAGEGFAQDDVIAAVDSFIDADARDMEEVGWSAEDVQVIRDQLATIHTPHVTYDAINGHGYPWRPSCSCGWHGWGYVREDVAADVAAAHAAA